MSEQTKGRPSHHCLLKELLLLRGPAVACEDLHSTITGTLFCRDKMAAAGAIGTPAPRSSRLPASATAAGFGASATIDGMDNCRANVPVAVPCGRPANIL